MFFCVGVTVGFGSDGVSVPESSGQFRMCVVRSLEALQDITVTIRAMDETAISNVGKQSIYTCSCTYHAGLQIHSEV